MGRPLARPSPSPLGTPPPRRLANFPRPECPGRTSSLPFLNNFAFGCHDLHSPARRSEPRNNKGVESTQQFGSPQSALCCAPRGFASGRHLRHSRTAPKPAPLPHISLLPPSRLRRGRGSAKPLSTLPPTPSSRIRLDGCGVCACAQRGRGGGGESGRLEKAGAAGCGGGGAWPEPALSSQRVPALGLARLSHVRAKNPLQSLFPGPRRPPWGRSPALARAANQARDLASPSNPWH